MLQITVLYNINCSFPLTPLSDLATNQIIIFIRNIRVKFVMFCSVFSDSQYLAPIEAVLVTNFYCDRPHFAVILL
jgi:hypothetical protein